MVSSTASERLLLRTSGRQSEEDGFCIVRIVLCGTGSRQRHIVVVGADDGNAFRILAHDAFHRGYSEVSGLR